MVEIAPSFLDSESYAGKYDRQHWRDILTEGIVESGDLEVTEKGTPNMSVDVAAGSAYVQGDQSTTQGHYRIYNDATVNKAIAASNPTNPRKDRVIAQVKDSTDIGGALDEWEIQVLTGTPAPAPVVPDLPDDALDLAIVDVGNGVTEITNANITDQRSQIDLQNLALAGLVTIATAQTIIGKKTFSDDIVFSGDKIIQTNVKARAYLSSDQLNLVNGTYTKVLLDAETYDVGADFANYKFTAPVTGYYLIIGSVLLTSVVISKVYDICIYKNNALASGGGYIPATTDNAFMKVQDILLLNATDYIELFVRSMAGVNTVDIYGASTHTFMTIHLISV